MEVVVDFEFLPGVHEDRVIKEVSMVAKDVISTLHFRSAYYMPPHRSILKGLSWNCYATNPIPWTSGAIPKVTSRICGCSDVSLGWNKLRVGRGVDTLMTTSEERESSVRYARCIIIKRMM
jgi:hypothetical protein